jgi:hypothetical protein
MACGRSESSRTRSAKHSSSLGAFFVLVKFRAPCHKYGGVHTPMPHCLLLSVLVYCRRRDSSAPVLSISVSRANPPRGGDAKPPVFGFEDSGAADQSRRSTTISDRMHSPLLRPRRRSRLASIARVQQLQSRAKARVWITRGRRRWIKPFEHGRFSEPQCSSLA